MGLLDDAIREHLDLKRGEGADPAEVERAEREALGPVRRNREGSADAALDDESATAGLADDHADEDDYAYENGDERPLEDDSSEDEPAFDEPALGVSSFAEPAFDDEPSAAPPPRLAPGATGEETTQYDVEKALTADDESDESDESDEDVLEETPEFLQDTPDHDRLWFEQRPPKDFDFDG
jgi:hypothetical protein